MQQHSFTITAHGRTITLQTAFARFPCGLSPVIYFLESDERDEFYFARYYIGDDSGDTANDIRNNDGETLSAGLEYCLTGLHITAAQNLLLRDFISRVVLYTHDNEALAAPGPLVLY